MTAILSFILKSKFAQGAIALTVLVIVVTIAIRSYGNSRESEGDAEGYGRAATIYADSLHNLRTALTRTDSLLSVRRDTLPRIVYRFRDRAVADSATLARLDSAQRAGESWQALAERMSPIATLDIDTTQLTPDSLEVRTTGQAQFDPFTRNWDAWVQSAPSITRTWMIRKGYILPPDIIRYPFSVEVMLGSPVKSPSLRISPAVWFDSYGLGIDIERKFAPVFKGGYRVNF